MNRRDIRRSLPVLCLATLLLNGSASAEESVTPRFAAAGTSRILWLREFASPHRAMTPKADAQGRVWIAGYTKSAGAGGWDVMVAALDPDKGFTDVFATFGGSGDDNGTAIQPLEDHSLLVSGYSENLSTPSRDSFVMRVEAFKERELPKEIRKRRVR